MIRHLAAVLAVVALLGFANVSMAQKLKNGDPAPTFSNLETTDGKKVSSSDFKKDVLVVTITCNHCPVAVAYEDRIIKFVKDNCGADAKVDFVAINVNNLEQDKLPAMIERAKKKGFNFVYAYDPSQKIAKDLGASVTPEFYVFNKERKLVYQGAMDDAQDKPSVNILEQAVKATLSGSEVPKSTRARGCSVKYEK
jgi:peroxiredoxin